MKRFAILVLVLALRAGAADWQTIAERRTIPGNPDLSETVWQLARPGGTYDKIAVHRYAGAKPRQIAFLYLPGTNMNGELALTDERHNLWLYLAHRGFDVYTLDYRTHFVPAGGVADFSFMGGWTYSTFLDDINEAVGLVKKTTGVEHVVLAGFSRGVSLAYFYASQHSESNLCGLVMLDGGAKNPYGKGLFTLETGLAQMNSRKNYAADVSGAMGYEKRQELMQAVINGSTDAGKQLADVLYKAWRPGGLANPQGGFSKPDVLAKLLIAYDRWYPQVQTLESAAIADRPDDDHIKDINVPLLAFQSTGMGPQFQIAGLYTAGLIKNPDLTLHVLEGFGHLDVVAGEKSQDLVFTPIAQWLDKRTGCK